MITCLLSLSACSLFICTWCLCIWDLNEFCSLLKFLSGLHTLIMAYKWFKLLYVFTGPSWRLWPRLSPPASLYPENQTALLLPIHAWPSTRANTAFWSRVNGAGGSWSCRNSEFTLHNHIEHKSSCYQPPSTCYFDAVTLIEYIMLAGRG